MSTFRELVYMCIDELKLLSDDAYYTEDHIIFLLNKYRAFLLKQRYSDIKKPISQGNYQTVEVSLEETPAICGEPCEASSTTYCVSTEPIPFLMIQGNPRVYSDSYFKGEFTYVTRDRMRYVGYNKYLKNITYCTIGPDNRLYLKRPESNCTNSSCSTGNCCPAKVYVTGVFQDAVAAVDDPNILDTDFPIESALVPPLIELVLKDLSQAVYRPDDHDNNSKDDLSELNIKQ